MERLTAQDAREIVEISKVTTIYKAISLRAMQGHYTLDIQYLTELAFKRLVEDGFRIFIQNGEIELTEYHPEIIVGNEPFIIDWEE